LDGVGFVAQDQNCFIDSGCFEGCEQAVEQRLAISLQQTFGPAAHSRGGASGQDHRHNAQARAGGSKLAIQGMVQSGRRHGFKLDHADPLKSRIHR
jgi:hypothetical protein